PDRPGLADRGVGPREAARGAGAGRDRGPGSRPACRGGGGRPAVDALHARRLSAGSGLGGGLQRAALHGAGRGSHRLTALLPPEPAALLRRADLSAPRLAGLAAGTSPGKSSTGGVPRAARGVDLHPLLRLLARRDQDDRLRVHRRPGAPAGGGPLLDLARRTAETGRRQMAPRAGPRASPALAAAGHGGTGEAVAGL